MVFQTLNRLKWTDRLEKCTVTIVSRGCPGDIKKISGKNITDVKKDHFVFSVRGKETFIPHHRVKRIRIDGETIWRRNSKKECFGPFAFLRKICQ